MLHRICLLVIFIAFFSTQFIRCQKEPLEPDPPINTIDTTKSTIDTAQTIGSIHSVYTPAPPSYSHFEGAFYCQKDLGYSYSSNGQYFSESGNSDLVITSRVSNDTLYLKSSNLYAPLPFIITSANQTSFVIEPTLSSPSRFTLEFYNNYDSIAFRDDRQFYQAGAQGKQDYYGARTHLIESSIPHAYINSLAGNYSLQVQKINHQAGISTQYTTNLYVGQPNQNLEIGTDGFDVGLFHRIKNYRKYHSSTFTGTGIEESYSIYWANDSLYFESTTIYLPNSSHGTDTFYYKFQGVKQ